MLISRKKANPLLSSHFLCFPSVSFWVQLPWKWAINLFPKGIPHATQAWQPQYDACCLVNKQFSWASLHFNGTFSSGPWSCEKCRCQRFPAFLLTQRCQMERVRISKHVNPHERKTRPLPPQRFRVHSACWKFPVLEQQKCAFEFGMRHVLRRREDGITEWRNSCSLTMHISLK